MELSAPRARPPTVVIEGVGFDFGEAQVQEQARRLGRFPNDRDLLACPNCGLTEDVLASGQLITNVDPGQPDTGLRFIEPKKDDAPFVCPACGAAARAQEA